MTACRKSRPSIWLAHQVRRERERKKGGNSILYSSRSWSLLCVRRVVVIKIGPLNIIDSREMDDAGQLNLHHQGLERPGALGSFLLILFVGRWRMIVTRTDALIHPPVMWWCTRLSVAKSRPIHPPPPPPSLYSTAEPITRHPLPSSFVYPPNSASARFAMTLVFTFSIAPLSPMLFRSSA